MAGAENFSRADDCLLEGQSAMPKRRDQPENAYQTGYREDKAESLQGLFCAEVASHCRNAASLGGSVRPWGETR
jgi:hypothetical protein